MAELTKQVGSINILLEQPTELTFTELTTWVIWQYPHQIEKGLCGAVCPPVTEQGLVSGHNSLKGKGSPSLWTP